MGNRSNRVKRHRKRRGRGARGNPKGEPATAAAADPPPAVLSLLSECELERMLDDLFPVVMARGWGPAMAHLLKRVTDRPELGDQTRAHPTHPMDREALRPFVHDVIERVQRRARARLSSVAPDDAAACIRCMDGLPRLSAAATAASHADIEALDFFDGSEAVRLCNLLRSAPSASLPVPRRDKPPQESCWDLRGGLING
jgi:hypothetical protein